MQWGWRWLARAVGRLPHQLPSQLTGRLLGREEPEIVALLADGDAATKRRWLRPGRATLHAPGGALLRTLQGHSSDVNAVAVTPDGQRAISASDDKTLKVWDLTSGECLATFTADAAVWACSCAPDGLTIVAGDEGGRVHFLRLENL